VADDNFERTLTRIQQRIDGLSVNSPQIRAFMQKIGAKIVLRAKQNVVRWRAVDTGRLLNSLGYRIETTTNRIQLKVGTINTFIRYGRMTEFGGTFSPQQMRAMFAALHARGVDHKGGKHVMIENRMPPRPFLIPAFKAVKAEMGPALRALMASTTGDSP